VTSLYRTVFLPTDPGGCSAVTNFRESGVRGSNGLHFSEQDAALLSERHLQDEQVTFQAESLARVAWLGPWKCRFVTPSVPDVKNFDAVGLFADVVEDAVGTEDDLAQGTSHPARIGGANEWERGQNANVVEDAPPEPNGGLRVILGDVSANLLEVRNRRV
jgi:hypothetical protein